MQSPVPGRHDRLLRMSDAPLTFRVRPALGVRVLGMSSLWLALVVVLDVLRRAVPALDGTPLVVVEAVFGAVFVGVAAFGAWVLFGRGGRLVLDADGFRNHTSWRRDSVRAASWNDVADVKRSTAGRSGGTTFVVVLADGRTSVIAASLLDVSAATLEEQLRTRLNTAHGYRPL